MLACSVAIERSTKEYRWISNDLKTGKDKHMSLFWVQGKQRVSDQEFGSYIIFAQDKEFILTSSRKEDVGGKTKKRNDEDETRYQEKTKNETKHNSTREKEGSTEKAAERLPWNRDIRAFTAVLAGGAGFTIQFIGLRGLPWPVAVAHLGAIIVMAMIRTLIGRRLGEDTQYCDAPSESELDFLAIQLVETKCCTLVSMHENHTSLKEVLSWRVATAKHGKGTIYPFDFVGTIEPEVPYPMQKIHEALSHTRET
ncbi:hypothetical protein SNK04_004135 [Fusarium graminearum]